MNQPVVLMTPEDVKRYRFLIETEHHLQQWSSCEWWCRHQVVGKGNTVGYGDTAEDAIDDLMRQLKWEPKS